MSAKDTAKDIIGVWSMLVFFTAVWPILIWFFFFTDYHGQFLAFIQPGYDNLAKLIAKEFIPIFEGKTWRDVLGSFPSTFIMCIIVFIEYFALYIYPILLAIGSPIIALCGFLDWSLRKSTLVVFAIFLALLAPQLLYTYNLKQELINGKVELTDFEAEITRLYPSMQEALRQGLKDRAKSGDLTIIPLLEKYASEFGPRKESDEFFSLNAIHSFMGGPKRHLLNEDVSNNLLRTLNLHGDTHIYQYTTDIDPFKLIASCIKKRDKDSCFSEVLSYHPCNSFLRCYAASEGYTNIIDTISAYIGRLDTEECKARLYEVNTGKKNGFINIVCDEPNIEGPYNHEAHWCTLAKNITKYNDNTQQKIRAELAQHNRINCRCINPKTQKEFHCSVKAILRGL